MTRRPWWSGMDPDLAAATEAAGIAPDPARRPPDESVVPRAVAPEAIAGVSREGEGPHRFPGVEAAQRGEEFFTSSCEYGCGAWIGSARSAPARDRGDPRYQSAYGDQRGVGTCPSNPLAREEARRPPDELRERCVLAVAEALAGYYSDKDPEGEATAYLAVDAVLPLVADATAKRIAALQRAGQQMLAVFYDHDTSDESRGGVRSGWVSRECLEAWHATFSVPAAPSPDPGTESR